MSITRNSLKNTELSAERRRDIKAALKRNMRCDRWANKIFKSVGVLLTSHPNNKQFLKASLESHKQLGFWTVVVYDNYWDPRKPDLTFDELMPERDTFDLADSFIISKHQRWGGVIYPYFWMLKFGVQHLSMFKYIYQANGDCVLEKPEGFTQLVKQMGDADVYFVGWDDSTRKPMANTTGFIAKTDAMVRIVQHVQNHFVPFDVYEKYAAELGSGEVRFAYACLGLGLKVAKPAENPYDLQLSKPHGTWYDTVGFRHLHGESKRNS
jgi:hypothetical protein